MIATWCHYPDGQSLLWLEGQVIGMVLPGEMWSTYYLVGGRMERGAKGEDEASARATVEAKLGTLGVIGPSGAA